MESPEADNDVIAEFQERRRQFKSHWTRTWLFFFLPGFIMFAASVLTDSSLLFIPGFGLCVFALARGFMLKMRFLRCPVCGKGQSSGVSFPYRTCAGCGTRLSHGWKDTA